jgi:hypothetical protein
METNYTIAKSTVECYKVRHTKTFYWADITVDHNVGKGRISIASDFGTWSHYWGACGDSFKQFLCKIGIDYAADKFGADRWFDSELTIKHFKEQIIELRKSNDYEATTARVIFDEIKMLEDTSCEAEFCQILQDQKNLMKFYDWCPSLVRTISPQFRNFWKEIWPVFTQQLKDEELVEA